MPKFYGKIGFVETVEVATDVWKEECVAERNYRGDLIRNFYKHESTSQVNDNINLVNQISIVADPYAYNNFAFMRYIMYNGVYWQIANVEVQYPRLILTIGGVYNGETARRSERDITPIVP